MSRYKYFYFYQYYLHLFLCQKKNESQHSVQAPPPSAGGELSLQPNFQKGRGGLTGPQLEIAGKEGVIFYKGVAIFTKK